MADRYTSSAQLLSKVLGLEKRAQRPLPAWHASPYDFDKFDLDKIGTGQGAASYGHGIYAAESPQVSGPLGSYDMEFTAKRLRDDPRISATGLRTVAEDDYMRGLLEKVRSGASDDEILAAYAPDGPQRFFAQRDLPIMRANAAKLYELKLHAAPEDFLDWDAPLSKQSEKVRSALPEFVDQAQRYKERYPGGGVGEMQGGNIYENSLLVPGEYRDGAAASKALLERGIPGMRYLDGGSRGLGDGTRNYVIFDPEIIEIAKKYGLMPAAVGAGALADEGGE